MIIVEVIMKKASGKPGSGFVRGVDGFVTGSKCAIESYVMKPTAPPAGNQRQPSRVSSVTDQ